MAHENVDVSRLHVFISPHHRMIAHLCGARRRISFLIHAGQYTDIRPWRLVVRVPLLVLDSEEAAQGLSHRMLWRLYANGSSGECRDVTSEANASHECGKPRPYRVTIEFAKQGGMMEADPSASTLLDVSLKGFHRSRLPRVRRI